MPSAHAARIEGDSDMERVTRLPVTKTHILNCSYHSWHPRYRSITPKARLVPLSSPFLDYLRSDGIRLPFEDCPSSDDRENDFLEEEDEDEEDTERIEDPSLAWLDIHQKIKSTIAELGGSVTPKLNWSAPKDATWIAATNSMDCRTPNDIYLLLKSSDFVTHDLEHVFDDCEEDRQSDHSSDIPYHLVLRKTIPNLNPALEFRCFVRSRHLLCMCQRDLNYFSFLSPLVPRLRSLIQDFFSKHLQRTSPDENYVFDIYIPSSYEKVWLLDINPWAPRTDPLLFSWLEILNLRGPEDALPEPERFVRLSLNGNIDASPARMAHFEDSNSETDVETESETEVEGEADEDYVFTPELRLVHREDPEAYSFNTPQYSAHKLPKDVVDASTDGEAGLQEFMSTWRDIVAQQERQDRQESGQGSSDST